MDKYCTPGWLGVVLILVVLLVSANILVAVGVLGISLIVHSWYMNL
jgi:hypothetical protein